MGKRIRIGIIYSYDENWIGGTYYYQNLIQSLNLLTPNDKPHLIIVSNDASSFDSIKQLNYPFISYYLLNQPVSFFQKLTRKVLTKVFNSNPKIKKINYGIDVLFHPSEISIPNTIKNHLYWIPDFQEVYLPHLFSKEYLDFRKKSQEDLLDSSKHILFSSKDANNDFRKLYPSAKSNTYVVNFVVFHPNYQDLDIAILKVKYQIDPAIPYFFSPNQFWKHKNHMIVLKAIKLINENYDLKFQILFSGKEFDSRNPTYFDDLKEYVSKNNLNDCVRFLGFIDRSEQLCFMKNALAVIQPSLFEGWSSVVEDAKAMNQNLIVSSLNVHKEQLRNQANYFNPEIEQELMKLILFFLEKIIEYPEFNYKEDLNIFGENFMKVIKKITA